MKTVLIAAALIFSTGAFANPQQEKMKECNMEAKTQSIKGQERRDFMKTCLSADKVVANSQHQKMKNCNAEAKTKTLKGQERKDFMKSCLSSETATVAPAATPATH